MSWTVDGLDEAVDNLRGIEARLSDLTPVMRVISEDLKTFIDSRFESSQSPSGAPWQPLKPATIARRRQGSSKPLVDTGRLRNSISARPQKQSLEFGTNVVYAGTHQFGHGPVPARPFLPVSIAGGKAVWTPSGPAHTEREIYLRMIRDYITEGKLS